MSVQEFLGWVFYILEQNIIADILVGILAVRTALYFVNKFFGGDG